MIQRKLCLSIAVILPLLLQTLNCFALDQIIRPYQSVRSAGMGGVRITTGLYDENFFNNPARATANPDSKFTVIQITPIETTSATLNVGSSLTKGSDTQKTVADSAGSNLHERFQLIMPAYYLAAKGDRKLAISIGMVSSIQMDAVLRQSYQASFGAIADIGPAVTIARKFLRNDRLSVGVTTHLIYRVSTDPSYSLLNYIQGSPLGISSIGGEGGMIDFDLGTTYRLAKWRQYDFNVGVAFQNMLGGTYANMNLKPLKLNNSPLPQPRSFGLGGSVTRSLWGYFTDSSLALEMTDFFNNANGSLFRLLHLGGETHWKSFALRFGLNQGYWAAGFGIDFHYLTLDLASYGEEMSLNTGNLEDRRYTLNLGIHI